MERLQSIKDTVDPNYMFDCNNCIGNKAIPKSQEEYFLDTSSAEAALNMPISATNEPAPPSTGNFSVPSHGALNTPVSTPFPISTHNTLVSISLFFATGYFPFLFVAVFFL